MNETHLDEFVAALIKPYKEWAKMNGWHNKNLGNAPYYILNKELNATIFGEYEGYEDTDNIRNQTEKNKLVAEMLTRSLDRPSVLFDSGTYNGQRLIDILKQIPKEAQKNIIGVYGIDSNLEKLKEAKQRFSNTNIPFVAINERIENLDYDRLMDQAFQEFVENKQDSKSKDNILNLINARSFGKDNRRIVLGLENIFLNIDGLAFDHDRGLTGFLAKSIRKNDIAILETHNVVSAKNYSAEVEKLFQNYHTLSGIKDIFGGELVGEIDEHGKMVYLTNLNKSVKYKDQEFDFTNHKLHKFGKEWIDRPHRIYIATSGNLQYEDVFQFLVFNFANNLYLPSDKDFQFSDNDLILRFQKYDQTGWIDKAKREAQEEYQFGDKNTNLIKHITHKELYPQFYEDYIYKGSAVFGIDVEEMQKIRQKTRYSRKVLPQTSFEKLQFDEKKDFF